MFGLRAYVTVNVKSKYEVCLKTIQKYADNLTNGESRKPWRTFSSVCGGQDGKEKRWVVDLDDIPFDVSSSYVSEILRIIKRCDSKYENPIVMMIPTLSRVHIITSPFNLQQFNNLCEENGFDKPDIKKNHITLLYENI